MTISFALRHENDFNEDYDGDRGGIVYKMDYFDAPRSSTRFNHYDDMSYDSAEENDEAFYSTTDVIYSFPKCKCCITAFSMLVLYFYPNNYIALMPLINGCALNLFLLKMHANEKQKRMKVDRESGSA